MKTPIVTIVGRPNTGKSTLFNKMANSRIAITSTEAGTTRDRLFHKIEGGEIDFLLVDTGGLEFGKGETVIENDMQTQSRVAIDEADVIVFVVEGRGELLSEDYKAAELLRKNAKKKPILLVANKCDNPLDPMELAHLYKLGLGEPIQASAINRLGVDILTSHIVKSLKNQHFLVKGTPEYQKASKQEIENVNIALVGKPNVGKSSLINAFLNKDKLIVSKIPGTTRDSTDSLIKFEGKLFNFIDTAGLKRKSKQGRGIEHFSALRSMASIQRCDIALLVIDSSKPISHQDQKIASYILESKKGLIIVANKWDIKDDEEEEEKRRSKFIYQLKRKFAFLSWAPLVFTSAVTKKNLPHIFEQIEVVRKERKKRLQTRSLNNFIEQITQEHKPTGTKQILPKLFYMTQVAVNPPHFVAFVNKKKYFHFSYFRYFENRLREKFNFTGTPIWVEFREKEARFKGKKK